MCSSSTRGLMATSGKVGVGSYCHRYEVGRAASPELIATTVRCYKTAGKPKFVNSSGNTKQCIPVIRLPSVSST